MKIFEVGRQFIKKTSQVLQEKICDCAFCKKYLPENIQLKSQPLADVYQRQINLKDLKLGNQINKGHSAGVFDILNQPELVARVEFDTTFDPKKLSYKMADPIRHIIAGTKDFSVIIMKKIKGSCLHGRYWDSRGPDSTIFFSQLERLKSIPDDAFIKYYNDLLELRSKGYEFDTVNPNNILYDSKKQRFNLVDIQFYPDGQNVTVQDFYPFIDGAAIGNLYKVSSAETKNLIKNETRIFLDRIENIGKKLGVDLSDKDYDPSRNYIPYRFEEY